MGMGTKNAGASGMKIGGGKRELASNAMVEKKVRFTPSALAAIEEHRRDNDGSTWAASQRAIFNAGRKALQLGQRPAAVAGTIGLNTASAPLARAA